MVKSEVSSLNSLSSSDSAKIAGEGSQRGVVRFLGDFKDQTIGEN